MGEQQPRWITGESTEQRLAEQQSGDYFAHHRRLTQAARRSRCQACGAERHDDCQRKPRYELWGAHRGSPLSLAGSAGSAQRRRLLPQLRSLLLHGRRVHHEVQRQLPLDEGLESVDQIDGAQRVAAEIVKEIVEYADLLGVEVEHLRPDISELSLRGIAWGHELDVQRGT